MSGVHATKAAERTRIALAAIGPFGAVVSAPQDHAAKRIQILCGEPLRPSHQPPVRPPCNLLMDPPSDAIVEASPDGLLQALKWSVRERFGLFRQHKRRGPSERARRLEGQARTVEPRRVLLMPCERCSPALGRGGHPTLEAITGLPLDKLEFSEPVPSEEVKHAAAT